MKELTFREGAALDGERLAQLYSCLGEDRADMVICEAMEAIALSLARISRAFEAGDLATLNDQAVLLGEISRKVGFSKLRQVAGDVQACAASGPSHAVALAATTARLSRVGDISLTAIWDPKDLMV